MQTLWREPDFSERQNLFREMVREAETAERVLMVFGLLRQMLLTLAQPGCEPARLKAGINHAVATVAFLRESLIGKPHDPFHDGFKRFYNQLHRQIIDAARDRNYAALAGSARSIETLISEAHADAFVGHCMEQSAWRENRLTFLLERLFAAVPEESAFRAAEPAFTPLRFA